MTRAALTRYVFIASLAGCATNPATGRREISLVSESQEIALGNEAATAARAAIGLYPNSQLQSYVSSLGQRLAALSERPGLPWSFEVLDDPAVNAMAAPGGKIFITRGILPFLDSEAELAGVVGHEIGHVTARHTARAITRQQLFTIGLVAGSIASSRVASAAGALQQGLQLLFLSYSRGDESQADELGFRYIRRAAYNPNEMSDVFRVLDRVGQLSGGGRVPTWASSHPAPSDRLSKAEERAATVPSDSLRSSIVNRDAFLRAIDGIVFGANPRQGYFEGGTRFLHPDLRFRFDFPSGWKTENQAQAVVGASSQGDAVIQLTLAGNETPDALLQKFGQQQGVQVGSGQRLSVHGNTAATAEFQAQDNQGNALAGRVMYIAYGGNSYELLGYSTASGYRSYANTIAQSLQSFQQLTDQTALNKQPVHLQLVRLSSAMTVDEFYRRYPSVVSLDLIAAINGVAVGGTLAAGTQAKRVQ